MENKKYLVVVIVMLVVGGGTWAVKVRTDSTANSVSSNVTQEKVPAAVVEQVDQPDITQPSVKQESGTIVGQIVDQYGVPLDFYNFQKRTTTLFYVRDSAVIDVVIVDALGDYVSGGAFIESKTLKNIEGEVLTTQRLSPGKYTFLIPGKANMTQPRPWDCLCFPIKKEVVMPEEGGIDLGDIEVTRFAKVTFDGVYNEVGTQINGIRAEYRDVQVTDPSANRLYWNTFHGSSMDGASWTDSLPPGTYTLEVTGTTYAPKLVTFEVADKDIDMGKIVLQKK